MTKLETILKQAQCLTPAEQAALIERLQAQRSSDAAEEDDEAGQRGLAAWTQSTRGEDWSAYYPPELKSDGEPPE